MNGDAPREPRLSALHYDSGGLIWGYRLPSRAALRLSELNEGACEVPIWLHLNLSDGRARKWLSESADLPPAALALLLEAHPRVRLVTLHDAVVAILEDLHHDYSGDPEQFGEMRFFVDARRVISVRRHPLKSIDQLHRQLQHGQAIPSTAQWLERLVEALAGSFGEVAQGLVEQVDSLEDEVVAGSSDAQRKTLAAMRRLLVRFRRHLNTDRTALGVLRNQRPREAEEQVYPMRQALEQLDGVAADLDLVHERVRLLQEEVASLLAEATNRNLYVLSIVTTALLPGTLITGFWGMNVHGLPWTESTHGSLWTGLSVVASIVLALVLLRGTRVL